MKLFEFTLEARSDTAMPVLALSPEPEAEPPVPPDAPIQEILFEPPSSEKSQRVAQEDSMVLSFVMSDPHIAIRMQHAVRNFFALYGTAGLESLLSAIVGDVRRPINLKGEPYIIGPPMGPYDYPVEGQLRLKLRYHFIQEREQLENVLASTRIDVAKSAMDIGLELLKKNQDQVLQETKRYLGLQVKDDETTAAALNSGVRKLPFTGQDILPLAKALQRIDEARRTIQKAEEMYYKIARTTAIKRAEWMQPRIEALSEEDIKQISNILRLTEEARAAIPNSPEMTRATEAIAERQAEFFAQVAAEAVNFPILYRMWDVPPATEVIRQVFADKPDDRQAQQMLTESDELRDAVFTTLRVTWNASMRIQGRLEKKDLNVWRYPPIVNAALRRLAVPPGTVEWQAANERVEQEGETISLVSALSTMAGFFELGVGFAGVAPPVAAAAGAISLLLQTIEWVSELWKYQEEKDAFNSSLNPAHNFGSEPSYVGVLLDLAFLALSAHDVGRTRALEKVVP